MDALVLLIHGIESQPWHAVPSGGNGKCYSARGSRGTQFQGKLKHYSTQGSRAITQPSTS